MNFGLGRELEELRAPVRKFVSDELEPLAIARFGTEEQRKYLPGLTNGTSRSDAIKLAELTFEGCRVDDSAVLGEVGQGFKIAMASLTEGRLSIGESALGQVPSDR